MSLDTRTAGRATADDPGRRPHILALLLTLLALGGCTMIGPDYQRPRAPLAQAWIDRAEPAISR